LEPRHFTFTAFSLWTNCQKLLKTSSGEGQLTCLNGFKALSMMWVIFGHVFENYSSYMLENIKDLAEFVTEARNSYIFAAPLAVDTFFAIGGMLTVYSFFKAHEKGVKFNLGLFYVHRYLRLTPALMAMILYQATLVRYAANRPDTNIETLSDPCREYWWSTILYIQNYVEPSQSCVGQSWYLMVDMQLFILTPLVLLPFVKWPRRTLYALGCLVIVGCIVPFIITYELTLNLFVGYTDPRGYFMRYYYIQTYARFGPYVVGMIFGYFIYLYKSKPELMDQIPRKNLVIFGLWLFAFAGLAASSYGGAPILTGEEGGRLATSIYNALFRNGWAICCCIVIALCSLGFGGPINGFLSMPIFQFLSKISYAMYMVHITLINVRIMNTRILMHFSMFDVMYVFIGDLIVCVLIAFFFCAIFESPIIILEKFLLGGFRKTKPTIINSKQ
ncbi:nose resistant to fluoxetine protein 6-like, partial [Aethina tumida]|uniref:nose resistant to fluoxetine protein 6-like n=1 Tax=Aethina tumida TaxID=116153 RepID=UPI002147BBA5